MNKMNAHKNDNPAVSVIIPVFNVEDYLDRCLESVANQSFSDMEIILVDDKSADSSGLICDKWAAKDSRMRVIRNECNSGAAQCRNTGLDAASGEYVVFVDSDDYIDEKLAEKAYNALKENKAQIAVYGWSACCAASTAPRRWSTPATSPTWTTRSTPRPPPRGSTSR